MKTILIPLDERPCNYQYPQMIASSNSNIELIMPDLKILGNKKTPAKLYQLDQFLYKHASQVDNMILSIDMLVYGGLIPSRLHHQSKKVLSERLQIIPRLKKINPQLKIYAFNCIMRCPSYNSAEEEPDYYEEYGYSLFRRKYLQDYQQRFQLTKQEKEELDNIIIPQEIVEDYENRRNINTFINLEVLSYLKNKNIDFLVIPQDDSSPFGYTAISQKKVIDVLKKENLDLDVMIYPGADEVSLSLLTRAYHDFYHIKPKVYSFYSSTLGPTIIPKYEDRPMYESLKSHVRVCGAKLVHSPQMADILLAINSPGKIMQESFVDEKEKDITYTSYRDLKDFVYTIQEYIQEGYKVALCDSAFSNGGDYQLLQYLDKLNILEQLISYAGWNTNCNTLGTTLSQAFLGQRHIISNLSYRLIEDIFYQSLVRKEVVQKDLVDMGLSYYDLKNQQGVVETIIKNRLQKYYDGLKISQKYPIVIRKIILPWKRMFEIGMEVEKKYEREHEI